MAIASAALFQDISLGPDSRRSPFISELVQITADGTGVAVGNTVNYLPKFGKAIQILGGAFRISGFDGGNPNIAIVEARVALAANQSVVVEMLCKL